LFVVVRPSSIRPIRVTTATSSTSCCRTVCVLASG